MSSNGTFVNGVLIGKGNIIEMQNNNIISFVDAEDPASLNIDACLNKLESSSSHLIQYRFILNN